LQKYLLIAMRGAPGSIARYWVGSAIASRTGIRFPYGTLSSHNGLRHHRAFAHLPGPPADFKSRLEIPHPIGFIGAYSTFSTYEWNTLQPALGRILSRRPLRRGSFILAWPPYGRFAARRSTVLEGFANSVSFLLAYSP